MLQVTNCCRAALFELLEIRKTLDAMENILKKGIGARVKSKRLKALVALSEGLFGC